MTTKPEILLFNPKGDEQGWLVVLENNQAVPFETKRCYFIYGTKEGVVRGHHAHRKLKQLLVCVSGSVDIYCEYANSKETFKLDSPNKGLLLDGLVWHEMLNFSKGAVLLVLADDYYDESDYVRDYKEFVTIQTKFVSYDEVFLEKSWEWLNDRELKDLTNTPDFTKEEQLNWFLNLPQKTNYFVKGVKYCDVPVGVWGLKNITANSAEYFGFIGEVNYWGKGIGRYMLQAAITQAKDKKLSRLCLYVRKNNLRAIDLYRSLGFEEKEGIKEDINSGRLMYMELKL